MESKAIQIILTLSKQLLNLEIQKQLLGSFVKYMSHIVSLMWCMFISEIFLNNIKIILG